jgi:putative sterol carrier protein
MIDCVLNPENAGDWQFRNTIGIGYFRKDYLSGGFDEPTERKAKTYASESAEALRQAKPCSQELLPLMELSAKKTAGNGLDFSCQFHISDDGDFYLTPENDAEMRQGIIPDADVTLELSRATLAGLLSGKINPTVAYAMRKLKVKGNITLALKLAGFITSD